MKSIIKQLGQQDYATMLSSMRTFTDNRTSDTADEIWFLEHPPVFTQGQAGKAEHVLNPGNIPIIQSDRGGQVTYHGPGQLIAYLMLDIKRAKKTTRELVCLIEKAIMKTLLQLDIESHLIENAPGVYVDGAKIAALGLRIRKGRSYHGLSFNVNMDLDPFQRINPCGYQNLDVTQISHWHPEITIRDIQPMIEKNLVSLLNLSGA